LHVPAALFGTVPMPRKAKSVPIIYTFKSTQHDGMFAFAGDEDGTRLPERHGPWKAQGNTLPHQALPHRFSRDQIELAIANEGFQLWRMKKPAVVEKP